MNSKRNAKQSAKQYIVRSERNPHMIYCTDGEFYPELQVGVNGWSAKVYKTAGAAKRAFSWKRVIVEEI